MKCAIRDSIIWISRSLATCSIISLFIGCSGTTKVPSNEMASQSLKKVVVKDFKQQLDKCNVKGSIIIYDNNEQVYYVSDSSEIKHQALPASTFKIINLLIALETKTITSEKQIIKWVGSTDTVRYGYRPEIYHDMTVEEAFDVSAGWVFVELAKKIGREKYRKYLASCDYGNLVFSQDDVDFWNFGNFAISPLNQVEFLKKFYDEKLPFSKKNIQIVKKVMINELTDEYTIRAKTGWTRDKGINTGWWVGYLQNKKGVYIFATLLLQDRKFNATNFGSCRKDITKQVLKELSILKDN